MVIRCVIFWYGVLKLLNEWDIWFMKIYEIGTGSTEQFYTRIVFGCVWKWGIRNDILYFTKWQLNSGEHYDKSILGREGIYQWQFSKQSEKCHMGMGQNQQLHTIFGPKDLIHKSRNLGLPGEGWNDCHIPHSSVFDKNLRWTIFWIGCVGCLLIKGGSKGYQDITATPWAIFKKCSFFPPVTVPSFFTKAMCIESESEETVMQSGWWFGTCLFPIYWEQ